MIISHRYRFLFVEIPHTASTAISRELCELYDGQRILHKHANYIEFLRQCSRDERSYYVFAGIRHPLDVIVTEYSKFLTNHQGVFTDENRRAERGGWVDQEQVERFRFVQHPDHTFADYVRRFYNKIYNNWFLVGHHRFNATLRFETISEGFARVLDELRIQPVRDLPVVNRSRRERDFGSYYDSEELRRHAGWSCGPFMHKWQFSFPEDWPGPSVPRWAQIRFALLEGAMQGMAHYARLDPTSPALRRMKKVCYSR
jgi:hypothetical protein